MLGILYSPYSREGLILQLSKKEIIIGQEAKDKVELKFRRVRFQVEGTAGRALQRSRGRVPLVMRCYAKEKVFRGIGITG